TAMMAFFLVMWLVGQKKDVKAAIAGYFRDPGAFDAVSSRGIFPGGLTPGVEPKSPPPPAMVQAEAAAMEAERKALAGAADHIRQRLLSAPEFAQLRDQVEMSVTAEGLRIELVERTGSSFFDSGSAVLRGEGREIVSVIAGELGKLPNDVLVEGHTDS